MDISVKTIVDAKGGTAKFAEPLGAKPATVRMWNLRGKFPRAVWPEIVEAFPDITLDHLKAVEANARASA